MKTALIVLMLIMIGFLLFFIITEFQNEYPNDDEL